MRASPETTRNKKSLTTAAAASSPATPSAVEDIEYAGERYTPTRKSRMNSNDNSDESTPQPPALPTTLSTTADAEMETKTTPTTKTTDATQLQARESEQQQQNHHHVMKATYPLPEPLVRRLQAAISLHTHTADSSSISEGNEQQQQQVEVEDYSEALSQLVSNSIEAMDTMYFSLPAPLRRKCQNTGSGGGSSGTAAGSDGILAHRLCLRIQACPENGTLTITDLGAGMTRADLINSLGIGGGRCSQDTATALAPRKKGGAVGGDADSTESTEEDDDDEEEEEDDEEEEEEGCSDGEDVDLEQQQQVAPEKTAASANMEAGRLLDEYEEIVGEVEESSEDSHGNKGNSSLNNNKVKPNANNNNPDAASVVSCKAADIGGFYAALCSLGTAVCVGTKAKHDDYYEFQLGDITSMAISDNRGETAEQAAAKKNQETDLLQEFCITRPFPEGTDLTVEHGFNQFHNVRGESGTSVCIRLNPAAIQAGLLDEQNVLKPLFLKIVETTQYTVAFSSDTESATAIIEASAKEREMMKDLLAQSNDDADMDLDVGSSAVGSAASSRISAPSSGYAPALGSHNTVKERAKYIPLRLSLGERKMLRLVEACMNTCDYTTMVDQSASSSSTKSKSKSVARRTHEQLKCVTSLLRGLVTACDYQAGQKLLQDVDANFCDYQNFYRQMFEIARRHKIMNPEKMRTEYGKLVYILQDAVSPTVRPHLGFSVKCPIESVYKFLEERNGLDMLSDKLIETATEEILAGKKTRAQIDQQIRLKEKAVKFLKNKYRNSQLSPEDIHLCLYSICDNNSFLNSNRVPIDKIIDYLTSHFSPARIEKGYSLSIVSGEDGARLSHSHERQFYFALQSLTLWRDIIDDMFRLWAMAEDDLLSESVTYSLQDTGQGMQRVQQCPKTYQAMQQILNRVQQKVSQWVGSSVIHMGDHNVPNALSFIDKYTQVPRILGPIVACLENLDRVCEKDGGIEDMINRGFGGIDKLKKDILYDFFRSAFDGSGADNFYDAGSCIDGRLTSAWNWCSQLPNKPFYAIFKLTGFIGFDGEFK